MAALTLRSAAGRPLSNAEVDGNFSALNTELGQKLVAASNLSDLPNTAQARSNLGLGNVENKSSATIRSELTSSNVTGALGFTPYNATNPAGYITSSASITGNAATVGGLGTGSLLRKDVSNTMFEGQESALSFENQGSFFRFAFNDLRFYDWNNGRDIVWFNDYLNADTWIQQHGYRGLYNSINGARFYPNDASYGAWRINGSRNGWNGLYFDTGSTLMMNSSEVGFHREGYGWQMWWSAGTGYVNKGNPGGGTQAAILDSSNYADYALPKSGGAITNLLYINSPYGSMTLGSQNSSHCHLFTDRPNFYFNTELQVNGAFTSYQDPLNRFQQGALILRSAEPTVFFRDTNSKSAMLHCNSDLFYLRRGEVDTESWSQVGGYWPVYWDLTNNNATFGGSIWAAGNITAYSDERIKQNWGTLPIDFVDRLAKVKSGTYDRTDIQQRQVGVSAQSLQELLPEAVSYHEKEELLSVAYGNAALASAIELAKKVVELEAKIEMLMARLSLAE